jgi:phosphate transport system substrate-binding protein
MLLVYALLYAMTSANVHALRSSVRGGGSTLLQDFYSVVFLAYEAEHAGVDVNMSGVGNEESKVGLISGALDFALVDDDFSPAQVRQRRADRRRLRIEKSHTSVPQYAAYPDLQLLPTVALPIAIVYNLDPVAGAAAGLTLPSTVVVDIFLGNIIFWDDSAISSANPTLQFTHDPINVIVPVHSPAVTAALTRAMRYCR